MNSEKELEEMTEQLQMLESRLHVAKIAYLNRTDFEGKPMEYEGLREIAQEFISLSYAIQKRRFGAVKMRISVAKLIR